MKLYEMGLHERTQISDGIYVLRVPGGWVYEFNYDIPYGLACSAVFVPLNSENTGYVDPPDLRSSV